MNPRLQRRLRFLKHGYRNRLDPQARERQIAILLPALFEKRGWHATGSEELVTACECAIAVLQDVRMLNAMHMWKLDLEHTGLSGGVSDKNLSEEIRMLRLREATMHNLISGMDLAGLTVRIIDSKFRTAKFQPDEDWNLDEADENGDREDEDFEDAEERKRERDLDYARYKCAALLTVVAEITEKVWPPIEKRISMSERSAERTHEE